MGSLYRGLFLCYIAPMANVIKLRRSAVSGNVPTTGQLELGEMAINTADGICYIKRNDGSGDEIVRVGGSSTLQSTRYRYETNTSNNPGSGKVHFNAAFSTDYSSVTNIYFNNTDKAGQDLSNVFSAFLNDTYRIYIQRESDASQAVLFQVTGAVSVGASVTTVPVSFVQDTGVGLTGGKDCVVIFSSDPSANLALSGLSDVSAPSPSDGQVLTWVNANSQWEPVAPSTGNTDLSYTASTRVLASSTGTDATLPEVVASGDSGLMTGSDKSKLDGIAAGATNVTNNNQLTNGAGYITSADGGNAATLDGIDSTQFLRSDTVDTFTGSYLQVETSTHGKFKLRVPSGEATDSNYIEFTGADGTRDGYVGTNSTGTVLIAQDGGSYLQLTGTAGTATISGNTIWTAGNDGPGSGLDADTVDGIEGSRIVQNSSGIASNLDTFYDADLFGWDPSTSGTTPEDYGQGIGIVNSGDSHNSTDNWITQLAFGTSTTGSYFRTKVNTSGWSSWRTLWNDANDGSGSGLDADLLGS